jgi:hypothetical protein
MSTPIYMGGYGTISIRNVEQIYCIDNGPTTPDVKRWHALPSFVSLSGLSIDSTTFVDEASPTGTLPRITLPLLNMLWLHEITPKTLRLILPSLDVPILDCLKLSPNAPEQTIVKYDFLPIPPLLRVFEVTVTLSHDRKTLPASLIFETFDLVPTGPPTLLLAHPASEISPSYLKLIFETTLCPVTAVLTADQATLFLPLFRQLFFDRLDGSSDKRWLEILDAHESELLSYKNDELKVFRQSGS